jgi:hypothetical protein
MSRPMTAAALAVASVSLPALAAELKIDDLVVAETIPPAHRDAALKAAKAFYQFWNTGDDSLLKAAIAPNFTDHTLTPGRPQGPQVPPSRRPNSALRCRTSASRFERWSLPATM